MKLLEILKITIFSYVLAGIAHWITVECYIRHIGKEITFSPIFSFFLTVPFWPCRVYADLKHIGILPQDIVAISVAIILIIFQSARQIQRLL